MFGEALQDIPKFGDEHSVPFRLMYPVEEAAVLCGISARKMWAHVYAGEVESRWDGGRRLVPLEALVAYTKSLPTEKPDLGEAAQ